MTSILDNCIKVIAVVMALLLFTGGFHYSSPSLKFELSQLDVFSWTLFILAALRKYKSGSWFSQSTENSITKILVIFDRSPKFTVALAGTVYFIFHFWILVWRYDSFHANAYDMGYVDQSLWSTVHGMGFLHSSISRGGTYLGEHFAPILGLVAQIYRLGDSVYCIFAFQTLIILSGSWFVFQFSRLKGLNSGISTLLAICYLVYQPVRTVNGFDFREDDLFIPIFFGVLYFIERERWLGFWLCSLLGFAVKENAPIFTALIGAWLLLGKMKQRRIHGFLLIALSLAIFFIVNTKITPQFAGPKDTMLVHRLGRFGHTNDEIFRFILGHPVLFLIEMIKPIFSGHSIKYILEVLTPFSAFASSAPFAFLIALIGIAMNILVNSGTLGFHYEAVLIPFLFYVLVCGVSRKKEVNAALLSVTFLLFFGRGPIHSIRTMCPTAHHSAVAQILSELPQSASITTQSALLPHLTHRRDAQLFSANPIQTDFAIYDFSPGIDRYGTPSLERDLEHLDKTLYSSKTEFDQFALYQKHPF